MRRWYPHPRKPRRPKYRGGRQRVRGISPGWQFVTLDPEFGSDSIDTRVLFPKRYSVISDIVNVKGWNPCQQWRCSRVPAPSNAHIPTHGLDVGCSVSDPRFGVAEADFLLNTLQQRAHAETFDNWWLHLYTTWEDQFPNDCSIANTLYELKGGLAEVLPEAKDIRSRLSSSFLKLQFGIEPFIRDIKAMLDVYSRWKKRLRFLQENRVSFVDKRQIIASDHIFDGTVQLNSYTAEFQWDPPVEFPPGNPFFSSSSHDLRTVYVEDWGERKWVATAMISNQIRGLDHLDRQVEALAGMIGLSNLPAIIWEATPWSWLIDWFVDVSSFFDRFEKQPFDGKLVIDRVYLSAKVRSQGDVYTMCSHGEPDNALLCKDKVLVTYYQRLGEQVVDNGFISSQLVNPYTVSGSPMWPTVDGTKTAIVLALIDQRTKLIPDTRKVLRDLMRGYGTHLPSK